MSNEIIIAITSSIASILVSIVSLGTAIMTSRHAAKNSKDLERLKYEEQINLKRAESLQEEKRANFESCKSALKTIQKLKDELYLILYSFENSHPVKIGMGRLKAAREQIFECYENHFSMASSSLKDTFHNCKNIAVELELDLEKELAQVRFFSDLPAEKRSFYLERRSHLTELQNSFRDQMIEALNKQLLPA